MAVLLEALPFQLVAIGCPVHAAYRNSHSRAVVRAIHLKKRIKNKQEEMNNGIHGRHAQCQIELETYLL